MVAKADNNSPGAMGSHHFLEENNPDHLPSKVHLTGDRADEDKVIHSPLCTPVPAGVQREWKAGEGIDTDIAILI